ncbi:MAG: DUF4296 domain-containing protein [Bacteroidia bacterium]
MKKILCVFVAIAFLAACKKSAVEKPDHLVSEDEMTNILYDMALLQAMKSYNNVTLTEKGINSQTYIFKKYKIDSLQLAQNHAYYASDLDKYSKMVRNVTSRINEQKKKYKLNKPGGTNSGTGTSKPGAPDTQTPPPSANTNRQLPLNEIDRK